MDNETGEVLQQLIAWHARKVAMLRSIAERTGPFTLKAGDAEVELNEREAAFFRTGMETVLMEIGDLPITLTTDEEPPL